MTRGAKGEKYADTRQDYYEERYRRRVMHHLARRARKLGLQLVPIPDAVEKHSLNQSRNLCFLREGSLHRRKSGV